MSAPELSDREREIVARFEAAPYPAEVAISMELAGCEACEESAVEKVARAIWEADEDVGSKFWSWDDATPATRADYRRMAVAAIHALQGPDTAGEAS